MISSDWDILKVHAYSEGYYEGRANGVYENPYESENLKYAFKIGYDRGVSRYCADIEETEE